MSFLSGKSGASQPTGNLSPQWLSGALQGAPDATPNIFQRLQEEGDNAYPTAPAAPPAGRPRHSFIDTIGRISDVLATVGGSQPLYQSGLDAQTARETGAAEQARKAQMEGLKISSAQGELGDAGNVRLGQAVRGLQAITTANPSADISTVWPILAQQAGVDPQRAQMLGQQLATNPELLKGLAGTVGATKEFGLQPFYAKGPDGALQAYQLSKDGTIQPVKLPEGAAPIDPLKFVDTGGSMVGIGTRSGNPTRILPKTEKPGASLDREQRDRIATGRNQTQIQIAGMPARSKATDTTASAGKAKQAGELLDELDGIYTKLDKAGAAVNPNNSSVSNVIARARASGAGQFVEGTVGTEAQTMRDRVASIRPQLMQSLAKATGMTGKQLDSNADVKLFMQTVTDPTRSTQANRAAIAGLRRFLSEQAAPAAAPAARAPIRPRQGAGKPSVSNW